MKKVLLSGIIVGIFLTSIVTYGIASAQDSVENDSSDLDNKSLDELLNQGKEFFDKGNYTEARLYYFKAAEIDPNGVLSILNTHGVALNWRDNGEEAILWFDIALEINPKFVPSLDNKAEVLKILGKYEEATPINDKLLEINPDDEGATPIDDKLLEINPDDESAKTGKVALEIDGRGIWDYSTIMVLAVLGVIMSVIIPKIKKQNTQKLLKQKEQFRRLFFFVKKTSFTRTSITYAMLFDKEQILFVHSHKMTKLQKESSVNEILKMSEHNFQILWEEVKKLEVNHSDEGSDGARTGELKVEWKERKEKFDIVYGQDFKGCEKIIKTFWPPSGSMPKEYV
jgi:tetratricopeptide (TPR) repeat protein